MVVGGGSQRHYRALIIAVMRTGFNLRFRSQLAEIATGVVSGGVELDVVRGRLESRFRSLQAAVAE